MDMSDIARDGIDADRHNDSDTLAAIFSVETVIKTEK